MPHAYCTTCEATVTVRDEECLAGHQITTPIIESTRGRHRAPSRWEKLRPGRIMTAGHHRRDRATPPATSVGPAPGAETPKKDVPPPRPVPKPKQPSTPPIRPVSQPIPPTVKPPAQPAPVRGTHWILPETAPRPVYSSSMLEMLGLDEEAGHEPTFTTMTSPQPVWQAPAPVQAASKVGLERLPTLSDMRSVDDRRTDTGTLIERLWFATEEHEVVRTAEELRAGEFAEVPARTFRWSVIISAVLVFAVAVALLQIGVRAPARLADRAIATYRSAVTEIQDVLPAVHGVMGAITDPTVAGESLSDAAVSLAHLDTTSRDLFTIASEPLPPTPPLVSRNALDELTSVRSQMADASQAGLAIERRLGDALTYRLVFDKAFDLPELPATAASDAISGLGVELGLGLATTLDAVSALPRDPAFEAHRTEVETLATRYAEWQIEYLSALRTADAAAATALIAELQTGVRQLTTRVGVPLRTVAAWAAAEIDRFDTQLERLLGNLG